MKTNKKKKKKPDDSKLTAQERLLLKETNSWGDRIWNRKVYSKVKFAEIHLSDSEIVLTDNMAGKILGISRHAARRVIESIIRKGRLIKVPGKSLSGLYRTNVYMIVSKTHSKSLISKASLCVSDAEIRYKNKATVSKSIEPLQALIPIDNNIKSDSVKKPNVPTITFIGTTQDGKKVQITNLNYLDYIDSQHPNVRSQAQLLKSQLWEIQWKITDSNPNSIDRNNCNGSGKVSDGQPIDTLSSASRKHPLKEPVVQPPADFKTPDTEQEKLKQHALRLLSRERRIMINSYRGIIAATPVSCFAVNRRLLCSYGTPERLLREKVDDHIEFNQRLRSIIRDLEKEQHKDCEDKIKEWET